MAGKGKGHRSLDVDGFEVLVGKGDAENDRLTFEVAEPQDFWLHVAGGVPGSHVVVRNPDDLAELPRPVVQRAAELAAWHSKARGARGKVEVHLCRAAEVEQAARLRPRRGGACGAGRPSRSTRGRRRNRLAPPPGATRARRSEAGRSGRSTP